jgi:hypothetical protein
VALLQTFEPQALNFHDQITLLQAICSATEIMGAGEDMNGLLCSYPED